MNRRLAVSALTLLVAVPLAAAARAPQNPYAARPAKEHALLQELAGTWKAEFRMTIPGAPPIVSPGSEVSEMLGELWLSTRYEDPNMMGARYSGAQLLGYDPGKKKYVAVWADSQTAELSQQEGTYDAATRTLTLTGAFEDPMTGQAGTMRSVLRFSDDDHRVQQMFVPGPGGAEMQMFEIAFERVK